MTKEQKIMNKIQELIPEIMELKKFCFLRKKDNDLLTYIIKERPWENTFQIVDWNGWQSEKFIRNDYKIIGRDITLEDVLRVIHKKYCDYLLIDTQGQFCEKYISGKHNLASYKETGIYWKLGKSIEGQLQKTKDFIYSIFFDK